MDGDGQSYNWAIQLGSAVFIAFAASWFTTFFARKRFLAERLWEKRAGSYGAIQEALYVMERSYEDDIEAQLHGRDVSDEAIEKSRAEYVKARDELYRRVEVEQFFLSPAVLVKVAELRAGLKLASDNAGGDYFAYLDGSLEVISKQSREIKKLAKDHLGIGA